MGNVLLLFPVRKDICFSFVLLLYSSYLQVELLVWGLGLGLLGLHWTDVRQEMCLALLPFGVTAKPMVFFLQNQSHATVHLVKVSVIWGQAHRSN